MWFSPQRLGSPPPPEYAASRLLPPGYLAARHEIRLMLAEAVARMKRERNPGPIVVLATASPRTALTPEYAASRLLPPGYLPARPEVRLMSAEAVARMKRQRNPGNDVILATASQM